MTSYKKHAGQHKDSKNAAKNYFFYHKIYLRSIKAGKRRFG